MNLTAATELAADDDEIFTQNRISEFSRFGQFEKLLRSQNYDRLYFRNNTLSQSRIRKAILSYYTNRKPLRSFSTESAFGTEEEYFQTFIQTLLKKQISNLTTLRIIREYIPNGKTCFTINSWLKKQNCLCFRIKNSVFRGPELREIFDSSEEEPLHLRILYLCDIYLVEGWMPEYNNLTKLSLWNITMTVGGFQELCVFVQKSKALDNLLTRRIVKTIQNAERLGKAIGANKSITHLTVFDEEINVVVPIIRNMVSSETLSAFRFGANDYPWDFDQVFRTFREVLPQAPAPLVSLSFGRTPVPRDIMSFVNRNIVLHQQCSFAFNNVLHQFNNAATVAIENLRCVLVGNGSDTFLKDLMNYEKSLKPPLEARGPERLLQKASLSNHETLRSMGIDISDHLKANEVLRALEVRSRQKESSDSNQVLEDHLLKYCTDTGQDILQKLEKNPFEIRNYWSGLDGLRSTMPFLSSPQEIKGVYLVSFIMSNLLGPDISSEIRMIVSLIHRAPRPFSVFVIGLEDEKIDEAMLNEYNFNMDSFKRFLSKKVFHHLSEIQSNNNLNAAQASIYFLKSPVDIKDETDDRMNLWQAVDKISEPTVPEIDGRWYMVLNAVRTESSSSGYARLDDFEKNCVNLGLDLNDTQRMLHCFEETGELLVLTSNPELGEQSSLVILDKEWLNGKLQGFYANGALFEGASQSGILSANYADGLWDEEEDLVAMILRSHAESLGLFIKLNNKGDFFLPFAISGSDRLNKDYSKLHHLFWINVPGHFVLLEFFNYFSGQLLKCVLKANDKQNPRRIYARDEKTMICRLDSRLEYAWVRCDKGKSRILLGLSEPLLPYYGLWFRLCRDALFHANSFFDSIPSPTEIFTENGKLNDPLRQRYPQIYFPMESENRKFVEVPYQLVEASNQIIDLESDHVDALELSPVDENDELHARSLQRCARKIGQAIDEAMANEHDVLPSQILLNALKFREKVDVRILCHTVAETERSYVHFLVSLLQQEGFSSDSKQDLTAQNMNNCKVIVVLVGNSFNSSKQKKNLIELKQALDNGFSRYLIRVLNDQIFKECQSIFSKTKSLANQEEADVILDELLADVSQEFILIK